MQCLSNDLVRRLLNTREQLPSKYRAEVVDAYGMKLLTSGYTLVQVRRILANGIKGYVRKCKRRKEEGLRLHRTAEESAGNRSRKRLLGKSSWFKGRSSNNKEEVMEPGTHRRRHDGTGNGNNENLRTRAVIFVEQTPQGELAKMMREQILKMEHILGYRLRVVERTGRNVLSTFPQTSTWKGEQCGREECVTCN